MINEDFQFLVLFKQTMHVVSMLLTGLLQQVILLFKKHWVIKGNIALKLLSTTWDFLGYRINCSRSFEDEANW